MKNEDTEKDAGGGGWAAGGRRRAAGGAGGTEGWKAKGKISMCMCRA